MATYFNIFLDTTAPLGATFRINADATYTVGPSVTGNFHTDDLDVTGYQVKVWGDVDGAATEGDATWVAFTESLAFQLTAGDGVKTVNAKIRDDVGNETVVLTDTIRLDTTLPVPTITVAFTPTKISKVSGWDITSGAFAVDTDVQAWKVKVVSSSNALHDAGTTIPTVSGSTGTTGGNPDSGEVALAADTNQPVVINGADLEAASSGDGPKVVKIFVQDLAGNWSAV